jgi:hypothetical protein
MKHECTFDPLTFALPALPLITAALLASYIPRTSIPTVALRYE